MFHARKSRFGLGLAMGTIVTAAAAAAAVMSYPPTKCMAEKLMKKGKRRFYDMLP